MSAVAVATFNCTITVMRPYYIDEPRVRCWPVDERACNMVIIKSRHYSGHWIASEWVNLSNCKRDKSAAVDLSLSSPFHDVCDCGGVNGL